MINTPLRSYIEQCGVKDMAMCLYSLDNKPIAPTVSGAHQSGSPAPDRPLFFYHMEKAGGLAVHAALNTATLLANAHGLTPPAYFRFHASDDIFEQMVEAAKTAETHQIVAYVGKVGLRTYGVHREIATNWQKMTLVRDPFDRVVSNYFYLLRRKALPGPASEASFMDYVMDWRNTNYHCRMLTEHSDADSDMVRVADEARAALATFDFVDTVENIERLLLHVWSVYKFLPVITQQIHKNPKKKDTFEYLRDDIYELNRFDVELVSSVKGSPTYPASLVVPEDNSINLPDKLGLVLDKQKDEMGEFPVHGLNTISFLSLLDQGMAKLQDVMDHV